VILELHRDGVDVHVQSAITEINRHRMHELLEPAREHGIPQRIFVTHSALGNGQAMTAFALDEVLAIYDELKALGLPLTVELPPLITGGASRSCGWGLRRCEIMANGDVTTCGPIVFTQTAFIAGNLRDQPLRELWQRSEYFSSLRAVEQSHFAGVCGKCKHFETCRGSCRAFAWSHLDDWFSPYPLCQAFAERYPERVREQLLDDDIALPPVRARTGGTRSLRVVQEPT
jgi:radical SAM protein with 4Fe4S-binding SPASM domain